MSDSVKKISSGLLLLAGVGVNFTAVLGLAYSVGVKSKELSVVSEKAASNELAISQTKDKLDDKIDELIKAVARIEGRLNRMRLENQ